MLESLIGWIVIIGIWVAIKSIFSAATGGVDDSGAFSSSNPFTVKVKKGLPPYIVVMPL